MNPLATEFTPSKEPPITTESRPPPRASLRPAGDTQPAGRGASSPHIHNLERPSIGAASTGQRAHPDSTQPRSLTPAVNPFAAAARSHGNHDPRPFVYPQASAGGTGWPAAGRVNPAAAITPAPHFPAPHFPSFEASWGTGRQSNDVRRSQAGFHVQFTPNASLPTPVNSALRSQVVPQQTPTTRQNYFRLEHPGSFASASQPESPTPRSGAATSAARRGFGLDDLAKVLAPSLPARPEAPVASGNQRPPRPQPWMPPRASPCTDTVTGAQYVSPQGPEEEDPARTLRRPPSTGHESGRTAPGARGHSARQALRAGRARKLKRRGTRPNTVPENTDQPSDRQNETNPDVKLQGLFGCPSPPSRPHDDSGSAYLLSTTSQLHPHHPIPPASETSRPVPTLPTQSCSQNPFSASEKRNPAISDDTSAVQHAKTVTRSEHGNEWNFCATSENNPRRTLRTEFSGFDISEHRHNPDPTSDDGTPIAHERQGSQRRTGDAESRFHTAPAEPGGDTSVSTSQALEKEPSQVHDTRVAPESATPREAVSASGAPAEASATADSASWSCSKRWMSNEMKERVAYLKMMTNLRHMKAEKSPCVPQSLTELAAFKAEVADANRKQLERAVGRRQAELQLRRHVQQGGAKHMEMRVDKLFRGKQFHDGKSPVFASDNCFNEIVAGDTETHVNWPSLAELKEGGDKRGDRDRRSLPVPRLRTAGDPRAQVAGGRSGRRADGALNRHAIVAVDSNPPGEAFITAVSPPETRARGGHGPREVSSASTADPEPMLHELPGHLQATILDLTRGFWDAEDP